MAPDRSKIRRLAIGLALAASCMTSVPALAQDQDQETRLRKIEAELRAVQRQVFPSSDGRFFTPEVDTSQANPATPGAPTSTPVSDMLVRLDSIEAQLARITSIEEENANTIAELKARLAALEVIDTNAVNPQAAVRNSVPAIIPTATPAPTPAPAPAAAAVTPPAATPQVAAAVTSGPSAERIAGVSAITKPDTGDAGADDYTYGFRLWDAKFYPEAQQQLRKFVETYPNHAQISQGRNLLGRAFLDAGDPRAAATWFLQNYQTDKNGARAGDSLLFLSEAMIEMKDTNRACIALAEFGDTYPALASGRLKEQYERDRAKVTCK
jgi:TolA-binding protein